MLSTWIGVSAAAWALAVVPPDAAPAIVEAPSAAADVADVREAIGDIDSPLRATPEEFRETIRTVEKRATEERQAEERPRPDRQRRTRWQEPWRWMRWDQPGERHSGSDWNRGWGGHPPHEHAEHDHHAPEHHRPGHHHPQHAGPHRSPHAPSPGRMLLETAYELEGIAHRLEMEGHVRESDHVRAAATSLRIGARKLNKPEADGRRGGPPKGKKRKRDRDGDDRPKKREKRRPTIEGGPHEAE